MVYQSLHFANNLVDFLPSCKLKFPEIYHQRHLFFLSFCMNTMSKECLGAFCLYLLTIFMVRNWILQVSSSEQVMNLFLQELGERENNKIETLCL